MGTFFNSQVYGSLFYPKKSLFRQVVILKGCYFERLLFQSLKHLNAVWNINLWNKNPSE